MSPASALFVFWSFLPFLWPTTIQARTLNLPSSTKPIRDLLGRSPRPTTAPQQPDNEILQELGDGLRRRLVGVRTCGYRDQHRYEPAICDPGFVCVTNQPHNVIGCISRPYAKDFPIGTSCIPSSLLPVVCTSKACETNAFNRFCSEKTLGFCYTDYYVFGNTATLSNVGCASREFVPSTYYNTFSGATFPPFAVSVQNSATKDVLFGGTVTFYLPTSQRPHTGRPGSTTSMASTPTQGVIKSMTSMMPQPSSPTTNSDTSSTPVGAIAGGAVGGAAVLLIFIGAIVFFCLRHRRKMRTAQPTPAHQGQQFPPQSPEGMSYLQGTSYGAPTESTNFRVSSMSKTGTLPAYNESHDFSGNSTSKEGVAAAATNTTAATGATATETTTADVAESSATEPEVPAPIETAEIQSSPLEADSVPVKTTPEGKPYYEMPERSTSRAAPV